MCQALVFVSALSCVVWTHRTLRPHAPSNRSVNQFEALRHPFFVDIHKQTNKHDTKATRRSRTVTSEAHQRTRKVGGSSRSPSNRGDSLSRFYKSVMHQGKSWPTGTKATSEHAGEMKHDASGNPNLNLSLTCCCCNGRKTAHQAKNMPTKHKIEVFETTPPPRMPVLPQIRFVFLLRHRSPSSPQEPVPLFLLQPRSTGDRREA